MAKNNIFIINGQKTCGKDYLILQLSQFLEIGSRTCPSLSTVDVIKSMYGVIGYKEDDPEIKNMFRIVLSDAKDSIDKNLDNWTTKNCIDRAINANQHLKNALGTDKPLPIFIHNREPEKITHMVNEFKKLGYNVRTLKVEADWLSEEPVDVTCHADKNINNFNYDIIFKNTKDVVKFSKRLSEFNTANVI